MSNLYFSQYIYVSFHHMLLFYSHCLTSANWWPVYSGFNTKIINPLKYNKENRYWYRGQYQDKQTVLMARGADRENDIYLASSSGNIFSLVRTTNLRWSVYTDIALHISNYCINLSFEIRGYGTFFWYCLNCWSSNLDIGFTNKISSEFINVEKTRLSHSSIE